MLQRSAIVDVRVDLSTACTCFGKELEVLRYTKRLMAGAAIVAPLVINGLMAMSKPDIVSAATGGQTWACGIAVGAFAISWYTGVGAAATGVATLLLCM